ncbi:MAG: glycosyltransferase [Bacteroidetes bacterium]|nr:MAG: glycosyltransferase [Bacteroidota bacterium]
MIPFALFVLLITLMYSSFLFWIRKGWQRTDYFQGEYVNSGVRVTVIVAARNEKENISACLNSLLMQDYDEKYYEVVVADDNSVDATADEVLKIMNENPEKNIRILKLEALGIHSKKSAISYCVQQSDFFFFLITDADCKVPSGWISAFVSFYLHTKADFIAGPVCISAEYGKAIASLQAIEQAALVSASAAGITFGKPMMCNAASMAFTKKVFEKVGGYPDNQSQASGDDTTLMMKVFSHHPDSVRFLKHQEAFAKTNPLKSLREFIMQRRRWAGKIPYSLSGFTRLMALLTWLLSFSLLIILALSLLNQLSWYWFIASLSVRFFSELILLISLTDLFNLRAHLWLLLPLQPFYWMYVVYTGITAPFTTYRWKGRELKSG